MSKVGAAFYHGDIFFKEAKRANRLKATHCLLSPSTISSFHTAQSEVAGPRREPGTGVNWGQVLGDSWEISESLALPCDDFSENLLTSECLILLCEDAAC